MKDIHIGREIERVVLSKNILKKDFAAELGIIEQNLRRTVFNCKDISTEKLKKISDILHFNFFRLYCDELPDLNVYASGTNSIAAVKCDINNSPDVTLLQERINFLEMVLAEKERLIQYMLQNVGKVQ